ncbi:MAG: hypothetical protein ABH862_03935 [Candidatus Omnitrophota bacterium]
MKKVIFILCLVLISNPLSASAASKALKSFEREGSSAGSLKPAVLTSYEPAKKEDNRYNGDDWNGLNRLIQHGEIYAGMMIKLALVRGIYEGAQTMDAIKEKMFYYSGIPYKGIVKTLDIFYIDENNLGIPVAEALKVVAMILGGEDKTIINDAVEKLQASFTY